MSVKGWEILWENMLKILGWFMFVLIGDTWSLQSPGEFLGSHHVIITIKNIPANNTRNVRKSRKFS